MSDFNHLFTGFSVLFDPNTSTEDKAQAKTAIQGRVENNMELINKLTRSK